MHSSDNQQGNSDASSAPSRSAAAPSTSHAAQPAAADGWTSNDAVTDFLGLDQDMVAAEPDVAPVETAQPQADAELDPSHSWLLAIEGEGPRAPSRGAAHADPEEAASRAPLGKRRAASAPPSLAKMAIGVVFAGIVIGAGIVAFVRWQQSKDTPPPVATTNQPAPTPNKTPSKKQPPGKTAATTPAVDPARTPAQPEPNTDGTSTAAAIPDEPTTSEPAPSSEPANETLASNPPAETDPNTAAAAVAQPESPRYESGARWSDDRVAKFLETFRPNPEGDSGTESSRELAPLALHAPTIGFDGLRAPLGGATNAVGDQRYDAELETHVTQRIPRARKFGRSNLRIASDEDLAGIWEGKTVPLDAIEKSVRLLTPLVGRVRILIHGGEVFEGRLYAVGQSHLWIDTDLGRMALEARQMAHIQHLSSPDGTPVLGAVGSQELDGLPRVRVRTLGGVLYGRLIGRESATVTLVTDGGARITVESREIEPAPIGRSLIVKGTEAKAQPR